MPDTNWGSIVSAEPEGLRERKKRRTKADLEAAALRLFAERGYDAVTVDDIAATADVSARTFFRHFGSKDDVLVSFHRERIARIKEELESRPTGENPLLAVRHAIVATAQDYETEKEDLFLRARVMAETPSLIGRALEIHQQWELVIAEAVADRLGVSIEEDLRPGLVGACAVAALRVASNAWLASEGREHLPTLVDAALMLIVGGGERERWQSGEGLTTPR